MARNALTAWQRFSKDEVRLVEESDVLSVVEEKTLLNRTAIRDKLRSMKYNVPVESQATENRLVWLWLHLTRDGRAAAKATYQPVLSVALQELHHPANETIARILGEMVVLAGQPTDIVQGAVDVETEQFSDDPLFALLEEMTDQARRGEFPSKPEEVSKPARKPEEGKATALAKTTNNNGNEDEQEEESGEEEQPEERFKYAVKSDQVVIIPEVLEKRPFRDQAERILATKTASPSNLAVALVRTVFHHAQRMTLVPDGYLILGDATTTTQGASTTVEFKRIVYSLFPIRSGGLNIPRIWETSKPEEIKHRELIVEQLRRTMENMYNAAIPQLSKDAPRVTFTKLDIKHWTQDEYNGYLKAETTAKEAARALFKRLTYDDAVQISSSLLPKRPVQFQQHVYDQLIASREATADTIRKYFADYFRRLLVDILPGEIVDAEALAKADALEREKATALATQEKVDRKADAQSRTYSLSFGLTDRGRTGTNGDPGDVKRPVGVATTPSLPPEQKEKEAKHKDKPVPMDTSPIEKTYRCALCGEIIQKDKTPRCRCPQTWQTARFQPPRFQSTFLN